MLRIEMQLGEAINGYVVKVTRYGDEFIRPHEEIAETKLDALAVLFSELKKEYEAELAKLRVNQFEEAV